MRQFPGHCSYVVGIPENANDNVLPFRAGTTLPTEEQLACGIHTDEHLLIVRDPISGDWHIEDYDGETVLITLPSSCTLDEVQRSASVYAAAFKSGFVQGQAIASSRGIA